MKKLIIPMVLASGLSHAIKAETRTKIAVIDTGISKAQELNSYMCKQGSINMTGFDKQDVNGHGSHIVHIIGSRINAKKFCIVSYKVYHDKGGLAIFRNTMKALKDINKQSFKYVNISMAGEINSIFEFVELKKMTDKGIKISVAAGNEGKDLDKVCDVYPACYIKNIKSNYYVVSAKDTSNSNIGKFTIKEKGKNVMSYGGVMSGSSQATAIWTSKLINRFK